MRNHHDIKQKSKIAFDEHPTPKCATTILLDKEVFSGNIWECASGNGKIAIVLEEHGFEVFSSDIREDKYVYGECGIDFLNTYNIVDNIITNPPYKLAESFCRHAIRYATKKVAMLCRIDFLESARRFNLFSEHAPSRIHVISNRLPFFGTDGEWHSVGATFAHCWFVWDKHSDNNMTQIDWACHSGDV